MLLPILLVTLGLGLGHNVGSLSPQAKAGRRWVQKSGCNRCHRISDPTGRGRGVAEAERSVSCVGCHNWILDTKENPKAQALQRREFPLWDQYLQNIQHFVRLPDLGYLTRRIRPDFVRDYLAAPFDLRPHLDESMIRTRLRPKQIRQVVQYLSELGGMDPDAESTEDAGDSRQGERLFTAKGCSTCHVAGNETHGTPLSLYSEMGAAAQLAPNLRHARHRMTRASATSFLENPRSVDPDATMPTPDLTETQRQDVIAYLWSLPTPGASPSNSKAPLQWNSPRSEDRTRLDDATLFEQVKSRVLSQTCIHCHMNPSTNGGSGGPGNTGGLTYTGVGLDLESAAGIRRGLKRNGKWVSVVEAPTGRAPLLWDALMRRHLEAPADIRPAGADRESQIPQAGPRHNPGMPLGLPPLGRPEMELVHEWLHRGAPTPGRS